MTPTVALLRPDRLDAPLCQRCVIAVSAIQPRRALIAVWLTSRSMTDMQIAQVNA